MRAHVARIHRFIEAREEDSVLAKDTMRLFSLVVEDLNKVEEAQNEFDNAYRTRNGEIHSQRIITHIREQKSDEHAHTPTSIFLVDFFKRLVISKREYDRTSIEVKRTKETTCLVFQGTAQKSHCLYIWFAIKEEHELQYSISPWKTCAMAVQEIRINPHSNEPKAYAAMEEISTFVLWDTEETTRRMYNLLKSTREYASMMKVKEIRTPLDPKYDIMIKFLIQHAFPMWLDQFKAHGLDKVVQIVIKGCFAEHYTSYQIEEKTGRVNIDLDPIYQTVWTEDKFEAFELSKTSIKEVSIGYQNNSALKAAIEYHQDAIPNLTRENVSLLREFTKFLRPTPHPTKLFKFLLWQCVLSILHENNIEVNETNKNTCMYLVLYQITGAYHLLQRFNSGENLDKPLDWI